MRLFRGLAISRDEVDSEIDDIRKAGMRAGKGRWIIIAPDLKEEFQNPANWTELICEDNLSTGETRKKEVETICACGDKDSALYYACIHNRTATKDTPVLVEFEALIEDIWVDGRDFLYTVVQFWDRKTHQQVQKRKVEKVLIKVFGEEVIQYLEKVFKTDDPGRRIALVDLIINDRRVIRSHFENKYWIRGRHGTLFRSAFLVRSPILPTQILSIHVAKTHFVQPTEFFNLSDILDR